MLGKGSLFGQLTSTATNSKSKACWKTIDAHIIKFDKALILELLKENQAASDTILKYA